MTHISLTSKDGTAMLTMSKAAKALGISRTALRKWIRKLDIPTVSQGQALCLTPEDLEVIRKARTVRAPRNSAKKEALKNSDQTVPSPALHDLQIQLREIQQREHELQLQNKVLLQEKKELEEQIPPVPALKTPQEEEEALYFFPSGKDFCSSPKQARPELWRIFLKPKTLHKTHNKT